MEGRAGGVGMNEDKEREGEPRWGSTCLRGRMREGGLGDWGGIGSGL